MEQRKKFYVAIAVFAALGLLIWMTIDDIPISSLVFRFSKRWEFAPHIGLRQLTLLIWGMFALRTVMHWRVGQIRSDHEREEDEQVSG